METQDNNVVTVVTEAQPLRQRTGPRWNRIFTSAALAVLAVLGWLAYDARQDLAALHAELDRQGAAAEKTSGEQLALASQREAYDQTLQARIGSLENRVQEAEHQFATIDDLHSQFARAREERALAEVGQAIDIAAQQLQLAGNVSAALTALQAADARLALLDQTRALPVRKLLSRDIERLKTLPLADVPRLALQIEALIGRIDTLPLGFERPVPQAAASAPAARSPARSAKKAVPAAMASMPVVTEPVAPPQNWLAHMADELWQEFRALVRIERLDQPDPVLLAPAQADFLRANLRLRLLSARVALLQRENRVFADDINQARVWLQRYFDTTTPAAAGMLSELDAMAHTRLDMSMPSLEETQSALRSIKPAAAVIKR